MPKADYKDAMTEVEEIAGGMRQETAAFGADGIVTALTARIGSAIAHISGHPGAGRFVARLAGAVAMIGALHAAAATPPVAAAATVAANVIAGPTVPGSVPSGAAPQAKTLG